MVCFVLKGFIGDVEGLVFLVFLENLSCSVLRFCEKNIIEILLRIYINYHFAATTRASHCAHELLRQCILPRAKFSELDAVYCSQFVRLMHRINAPAFPTFALIYQVLLGVLFVYYNYYYWNSSSMVLVRY